MGATAGRVAGVMKKKPESDMVLEAEAMLAVAKVLQPLSKEKACAVMASASVHFGEYDKAIELLELAKHWRIREN